MDVPYFHAPPQLTFIWKVENIHSEIACAFSAEVPLFSEKLKQTNGGKKMKNISQKIENVSPQENETESKMSITKEQAKYWYAVAKKDLTDGNREGAWNIYRWLSENNAWFHAKLLKNAIKNST
jgi:hypothetical protein